jgi:dienelactone hydrolase
MMFHVERLVLGFLALLLGSCAVPPVGSGEVRFPGPGIELRGRLYVPDVPGRHPAIVLLHGCSGLWGANGQPAPMYQHWAEMLRAQGFLALHVDSFGPRGEKEICTKVDRPIRPGRERVQDAMAALRWLAARPDVDPDRIHVMGWSNGGSTVLYAIRGNAAAPEPRFRSAVAFYPGCRMPARATFRTSVALLIQVGGADDWTPASFCEDLARRAQGAPVEIDVYPGAHHAFDNIVGQVRSRPNVANANRAGGRGATVGPDPEARARAVKRTLEYLAADR